MPTALPSAPRLRNSIASLLMLLLLFGLASGLRAATTPRASVDRTVVVEGDSLTLTIHVDDTGGEPPDFAPLQRDFETYGSSQSTQRSLINGRLQSATEWQVTLTPKRSGDLVIPALAVAGGSTQPLVIRVTPAGNSAAADETGEPAFLEVQLDRQSAYVQQQVILTVRVFVSTELEALQLSEPEFDNATVRKVSETKFRRDIRGVPYVVFERTYAIFPQQPGELTIPELVFNAVQPTMRRSLFDFPGQGRRLHKMSKQLQLSVKPIPKSFTGAVWLPARNLTLAESWSKSTHTVNVGDSLTRNITVQADGLLAAQLPAQEAPQLDNAKIYSDQPTLDDQQDARGVHGKRIDNMALIPSRAGDLKLPEVRVVWWDVDSDSEKIATLAPAQLHIAGSAPAAAPAPAAVPAPQTEAEPAAAPPAKPAAPAPADFGVLRLWQLAAAVLALAWLVTLYLYWRARTRVPAAKVPPSAAPVSSDEPAAFDRLRDSCRSGEPRAARAALIAWARAFLRDSQLHTTEQMIQRCNDAALTREIQQLDNRLFGNQADSGAWNGENLLSVVRELRKHAGKKIRGEDALPPLYPGMAG